MRYIQIYVKEEDQNIMGRDVTHLRSVKLMKGFIPVTVTMVIKH